MRNIGRVSECLGTRYGLEIGESDFQFDNSAAKTMASQPPADLLDELGESAMTGKNVGQDARHLRSTFTAQFGAEEARRLAHGLLAEGKQALWERFGERQTASLLMEAADLVIGGVVCQV